MGVECECYELRSDQSKDNNCPPRPFPAARQSVAHSNGGLYIGVRMTLTERFWNKVDVRGPDECWLWTGYRNAKSYGQLSTGQKPVRLDYAHRVAWKLTNGSIPHGHLVCHHCDNPPCCNPRHLFTGTAADNNRDMSAKGRSARGQNFTVSKLGNNEVQEIRSSYVPWKVSQQKLARRFGISRTTVGDILRGRTWNHLVDASSKQDLRRPRG